jgi:hypothetical protein
MGAWGGYEEGGMNGEGAVQQSGHVHRVRRTDLAAFGRGSHGSFRHLPEWYKVKCHRLQTGFSQVC